MGNEILEKKIDDNKNNLIEDKELLKFIGNQKNTEELGSYLNSMTFKDRGDKLYRATQEQIENNIFSISKKVKEFKPLTIDEKNIMKLQYFIENRNYPQSEVIFNLYLGNKFNNQQYGSKISFIKKESPLMANQKENRELSKIEKRLQMETILETGQYYIQFLQDKGILQPQYEGDKPQQNIYFNELQSKYANGEVLREEEVLFYTHQIFRDISISGLGYSSKAGDAYKQIDKIFTSKDSWNQKNIEKKKIEVLYQIRQIDDAKGVYYKSSDILISTLSTSLGSCRVNRGPEPGKLNNALMQFNFFKPLENGNFSDPIVENMYKGFQNTSTTGENDILLAFKKYKLPFEGADKDDMDEFEEKLRKEMDPIKKERPKQQAEIKTRIVASQTEEISKQKQDKETLKKDFQNQNISLDNPFVQQVLAYFGQQIAMKEKLINGGVIEMEKSDGGKKSITLDMIVSEQYDALEIKSMIDIFQKGIIFEVLDQNQKTTNFIRDMKKSGTELTSYEKNIDMLSDITGAGDYRSDKTFNTTVDVTKELVIQVALMAISGGIANIAAKGTLLAIQGGANLLKAGSYASRVARYTNMSKTAFWSSIKLMPELFAADIIAEGTVFHLANTALNAPLQGLSTEEYFKTINPFGSSQEQLADGSTKNISNAMGYLESVAFMGVMKSFGSVTNQITKALGGKTLNAAQQSQTIKNILIANSITLPGEILGMQATSTAISLSFGHDVDLTPQSRAHTLALVIGLRIAHNATSPMKKESENIEGKIQENSMQQGKLEILNIIPGKEPGRVKAVEYRVLDAKGKEIDRGIASKETIDAALKSKKQSETNPESSKNQLNISPEIQEKNSLNSDKLINSDLTINTDAKSLVEKFLREQNVIGKDQTLSEDQIRIIYKVHNMEKKLGETEAQLNKRKGLVLRELFTVDQIRALMEGKVCGIIENKTDIGSLNIEKKDTENLLPNEFLDYMIATQKRFLETKIKRNPDIKVTDNVSFEENITLVNHNDMGLVNPPKKIIKIEINTTLDKFIDQYNQAIKDNIGNLSAETAYSIYDFNQDIHFKATGDKEAKNESGWRNYISNGSSVWKDKAINNNKTPSDIVKTNEEKIQKYFEIITTPLATKDSRLSNEAWDKIDEFKKNNEGKLYMENVYNDLDVIIIRKDGQTLVSFIDKNSEVGEPPKNFPLTEDQIPISDKEKFKHIVGYVGCLGGSFSSKNFEAKSHYGQAFHNEYTGKGLAGLTRNIKEYIDGILQNDYSGKLSNTEFLIKRGYYPKNYVDGQGNIVKMSPKQQDILKKALQEKKNEVLPFTVQLEYNKTESEKYLLEIQKTKPSLENNKDKQQETIQYKVHETKFLEIKKNTPYSIETVELNGCTGAVIIIKNNQGKSFALATHFPPIQSFRDKSITEIKKYLEDNKATIGNISSINIFAVTDVSRKNTDYQTIVDAVKEKTKAEPALHLSEYASKDKSRSDKNQLGKMNIGIDKEGKINFIHEGKDIDVSVTVPPETKNINTSQETNKNQLNISPEIQEKNSLNSDKLINSDLTINADAKFSVEQFLREQNVLSQDQALSEEQIRKIYEVHTMKKNPGEADDLYLNIRKGIALKSLFTVDQIRALMEGNICGKNTREKIIAILEPIMNFLARGEVDLALSYVEKTAPSMEYVATEAPKKLVDIPRAFLDGYLRSKGVAERSDLTVFLGDIRKLKDSIACSIQLYTENLGNINKLEETIANARLPRNKRVDVGYNIIENIGNFKLSELQREIMQKAIMSAHAYGHAETGKNGDPASIYNYTLHQLGNKMYILMDAMQKCGIEYSQSKEIAKELLRKGICGSFFPNLLKKIDKPGEVKSEEVGPKKIEKKEIKLGKDIKIDVNISEKMETDIRNFYEDIKKNNTTKDWRIETNENNIEQKIEGEKAFYKRVLNEINKAAIENPDKEINVLFDIDDTLAQKSPTGGDILRPSALVLLETIHKSGVNIGFLTDRRELADQLNDNNSLGSLKPFINQKQTFSTPYGVMLEEEVSLVEKSCKERGMVGFNVDDWSGTELKKIQILNGLVSTSEKVYIPVDDIRHPTLYKYGIALDGNQKFKR